MGLPARSPVWPCQDPGSVAWHVARPRRPRRPGDASRRVASRSRSLGDGAARALGVTAVPVAGGPAGPGGAWGP